jgi:hypothetical protein
MAPLRPRRTPLEISRGSRRVQSGLRWVCVDEVPAEEGFGQVRGSG